MGPRYQDELLRIDRLLEMVIARRSQQLGGAVPRQDLIVFACQSVTGLYRWLERDPGRPVDWDAVRADVKREPSLVTCARIANGMTRVVRTRPNLNGGVASLYDPDEPEPVVRYYVGNEFPGDLYAGAEVEVVLIDGRQAWQRIIDRHWLGARRFSSA